MIKRFLRSPITTVALFVIAAGLILGGGVSATRAALTARSEFFGAQIELSDIETAITENGEVVGGKEDSQAKDALLGEKRFLKPNKLELSEDGSLSNFEIGRTYDEVLAVRNIGNIDQYVRVTVRKYWEGADGKKRTDLDPDLIVLNYPEGNGWVIDTDASTPERTVLYYQDIIRCEDNDKTENAGASQDTKPFVDKLTISSDVLTSMTGDEYDYEDVTFRIEAEVDAVQTHNDQEAMMGAWGRTKDGYEVKQ